MLDELSREELITKCKGLLAIAQKAKQAKNGNRQLSVPLRKHPTGTLLTYFLNYRIAE